MEQQEIWIKSTSDGTMQPSLFYRASQPNRPLLVGLHTWSFDRFNQIENLLPLATKHDFHLLLPEFRGPNRANKNPNCQQACGSQAAKQDIVDAIDYVIATEGADRENVFLVGLSGGGHMALLMAGFCPEKFRAIAAFVPITDLEKWSVQNPKYGEHVHACCGTDPVEMAKRSPMYYLDTIARANLKIFHGKRDSVVPVSHSIELFCRIQQDHPDARVFLDIFDGGHQIDINQAEYWIISQYQKTNIQTVTG